MSIVSARSPRNTCKQPCGVMLYSYNCECIRIKFPRNFNDLSVLTDNEQWWLTNFKIKQMLTLMYSFVVLMYFILVSAFNRFGSIKAILFWLVCVIIKTQRPMLSWSIHQMKQEIWKHTVNSPNRCASTIQLHLLKTV